MALIVKTLNCGQITSPGSLQTLYSTTASNSALVSSVRLVNVSTTVPAITLMIWSHEAGRDFRLDKKGYSLTASSSLVIEDPITLAGGDFLWLDVSNSNPRIHFQVNGVERNL